MAFFPYNLQQCCDHPHTKDSWTRLCHSTMSAESAHQNPLVIKKSIFRKGCRKNGMDIYLVEIKELATTWQLNVAPPISPAHGFRAQVNFSRPFKPGLTNLSFPAMQLNEHPGSVNPCWIPLWVSFARLSMEDAYCGCVWILQRRALSLHFGGSCSFSSFWGVLVEIGAQPSRCIKCNPPIHKAAEKSQSSFLLPGGRALFWLHKEASESCCPCSPCGTS